MTIDINRRKFVTSTGAAIFVTSLCSTGPRVALAAQQETVLSVTPAPGVDAVHFTDNMLSEMPQIHFTTQTIWTDGPQRFSGPSLMTVLDAAGVRDPEADILLGALNGYSATCPAELITANAPIIANRRDELPFGVREKGPLWVVFPYDADVRFRSETIYAISVWQLTDIKVS